MKDPSGILDHFCPLRGQARPRHHVDMGRSTFPRNAALLLCVFASLALGLALGKGRPPKGRKATAAAVLLRAEPADLRRLCNGDCGLIDSADLRRYCNGDCGLIDKPDVRRLCNGDCGLMDDPDMRRFCNGDCGLIDKPDLRRLCNGDCGLIDDANLRRMCDGSCGLISQRGRRDRPDEPVLSCVPPS
jgi:hypothetical protein